MTDVVGLLDIQSDKLNAFTEDDQVMFEAVADTMAAAIRNADLYRSEQWRRQVSRQPARSGGPGFR
jgi:GAF domain-containing protein